MSKVKNDAKIKNPIIGAVREQLEHRHIGFIFFVMKQVNAVLIGGISVVPQLSVAD